MHRPLQELQWPCGALLWGWSWVSTQGLPTTAHESHEGEARGRVRSTVHGRNGAKPWLLCHGAAQTWLPCLLPPQNTHCLSHPFHPTGPEPGLSQHQGNHINIPDLEPSIPNAGSRTGSLPTALPSPPRSPGSYHDFLEQRDSLMKWKRRRRSKLNGLS